MNLAQRSVQSGLKFAPQSAGRPQLLVTADRVEIDAGVAIAAEHEPPAIGARCRAQCLAEIGTTAAAVYRCEHQQAAVFGSRRGLQIMRCSAELTLWSALLI